MSRELVWSERHVWPTSKDAALINKFTQGKYRVQANKGRYRILKIKDIASTPMPVYKLELISEFDTRDELVAMIKLIMASEE